MPAATCSQRMMALSHSVRTRSKAKNPIERPARITMADRSRSVQGSLWLYRLRDRPLFARPIERRRLAAEGLARRRIDIKHVPAAVELELHAPGRADRRQMVEHIARHA